MRSSSSRPANVYGNGVLGSSKRTPSVRCNSGHLSASTNTMNEAPLTSGHVNMAQRTPIVRYENNYEVMPLTENYRHKSTGVTMKTRHAHNEENIVPIYNSRTVRIAEDPMTSASMSDLEHQKFILNDTVTLRSKDKNKQKYLLLKQKSSKAIISL